MRTDQIVLEQGIHYDVPDEIYRRDPCPEPSLNASIIKTMLRQSPMHARMQHPRLNPKWEYEDWRDFDRWSPQVQGQILHEAYLLGEQSYGVVEVEAFRSNDAKAQRAVIRASGRVALSRPQYDRVIPVLPLLQASVAGLEDEPPLFSDGKPEVTIVWYDEEFKIWCRERPDWLRDDLTRMDDLKTSTTARPDSDAGGWGRIAYDKGADIQQAFYLRGLRAVHPEAKCAFRFVVFEPEPPHGISLVDLGPIGRIRGETLVGQGMSMWKQCMERGQWPGYPKWATRVDPPAYAVKELEDGGRLADKEMLDF